MRLYYCTRPRRQFYRDNVLLQCYTARESTKDGRAIGTISGEKISYIAIPGDPSTDGEITVSLNYEPNANVGAVLDLSIYGPAAVSAEVGRSTSEDLAVERR